LNLNNIHNVYFIGIGGIGMSALARYMRYLEKEVAGYDKTPSPITQDLIELNISIQFEDDLKPIPPKFWNSETTLIVYTPAVKRNENTLLDHFLSNNFNVLKRAELLGVITQNTICLAVAGTHGKTTTSSILGHILKEASIAATSFLGGIAENYNSNLILGGDKYSVVEADEFDRSFLQLQPNVACITSVDADHLDIYENGNDLVNTFKEFGKLATQKLFVRKGIPIEASTYGINENADYDASNIRIENGAYLFDVKTPTDSIKNLKIFLPGQHNVLNTMAALAMANSIGVSLQNIAKALLSYQGVRRRFSYRLRTDNYILSIGVSLQDIAKALLSYQGVHRRFSYRLRTDNYILIDDYAHHPTEINAVYSAVREMYPKEKLLVVFQPHLFSRTRDFENEFVKSLSQFNEIFLLPIYPAREHPITGVTSEVLVKKIREINPSIKLVAADVLVEEIGKSNKKIIVMLGAGDIGEMVVNVQEFLKQEVV